MSNYVRFKIILPFKYLSILYKKNNTFKRVFVSFNYSVTCHYDLKTNIYMYFLKDRWHNHKRIGNISWICNGEFSLLLPFVSQLSFYHCDDKTRDPNMHI